MANDKQSHRKKSGATGKNKKPGRAAKTKRTSQAARADRHELYQQAVQCVEAEIDFVEETFRAVRKRRATHLREDFCGTANTATEWVKRRRSHVAFGVDIDAEVLDWGERHNRAGLAKSARSRLHLIEADVMTFTSEPMDAILAMNFSYWLFRERRTLRRYFKRVRDALKSDGLFFLDAYGGYECHKESVEETDHGDFTYIWEQASFDPISAEMSCYIHFKFPDRSRLDKAFSYSWRFWQLPELLEILHEAGFANSTVYWQDTDPETEEANGEFYPAEHGEADPAWIVYIVAEK